MRSSRSSRLISSSLGTLEESIILSLAFKVRTSPTNTDNVESQDWRMMSHRPRETSSDRQFRKPQQTHSVAIFVISRRRTKIFLNHYSKFAMRTSHDLKFQIATAWGFNKSILIQ